MARSRQSGSAGGSAGGGRSGRAKGARTASRTRKTENAPSAEEAKNAPGTETAPSGGAEPAEGPEGRATAPAPTDRPPEKAEEKAENTTEQAGIASGPAPSPAAGTDAPGGFGAAPEPASSPRPGWRMPLLGGLVGGAAAALVVLYLAPSGPPDPRLVSRLDELGTRLSGIESDLDGRLSALEEGGRALSGRVEELTDRLASLEEKLEPLEALPARVESLSGGLAEATARLDALEGRLDGLRPTLDSVAGLTDRLAAVEKRLDELALSVPGGDTPLAGELTARLDALEGNERELRDSLARLRTRLEEELGGVRDGLARLEEERRRLAAAIDGLGEELRGAREALAGRVGDLDGRLATLAARVDGLDGRLADLDARLGALDGRLASLGRTAQELDRRTGEMEAKLADLESARERAVGLVLAANALSLAALEGGSLAEPLADIEALAGEDAELQALVARLRPHAETGVPTLARLRERFDALAPAMLGRRSEGESVLEKTRSNLEALVTIRRRGESLDPAEAAVDRARNALAEGRVEEAVAALKPLAEAGNEAAREWVALAEARLAALATIADLDAYVRRLLVDTRSKS